MKILKNALDFYINASIHVGLSCFLLVITSQFYFNIPYDFKMAFFVFFGTIVGYNFVKYEALFRIKKAKINPKLKFIFSTSFSFFLAVVFCFFQLNKWTQLVSIALLIMTLLYALPFFPNQRNARNWSGFKIYIVSLCWVGATVVLPILNAEISINLDFYLICIQRFILIFVLILIFEIIDLKVDDPHLKTVPQQIGVKLTKQLGYLLLFLYCFLEVFTSNFSFQILLLQLILIVVIALFLFFANEKRSKYYTSFWVESVPIMWWLMVLVFKFNNFVLG